MALKKKPLDIRLFLYSLHGRAFFSDQLIDAIEDIILSNIDVLSDDLDVSDYIEVMCMAGWVTKDDDLAGYVHVRID
jgi:hypothetical protein